MPYYSAYFSLTFLPILLVGLYFIFEHRFSAKYARWLWWTACLVLLLGVAFFLVKDHALYDFFKGYYHGGRKIQHNPDLLYDEACYNYVNFPLFAYLFAPLANLPKEIAGQIFFAAGYVALLPLAYWLIVFVGVKGWRRFVVLALLLFSGPLDYSIWLGNTTQIIMLLVILGLFSFRQKWDWLSGIFFGIAGLVKIPLILPSGYFFARGKWKIVGGGLLVAGAAIILSLILIDPSLNNTWLDRCVFSMAGNPIGAYNNQSLSGFLARIYMPGNLGWNPLTPTAAYGQALRLGSILLYSPVFIVLIRGIKMPQNLLRQTLEFFIVLLCSLLTSPIAWTHYFVLTLLPFSWYMADDIRPLRRNWLSGLLMFSVVLISIPKDFSLALFERTNIVLLLSPQFMGGLLLYGLLLTIWVILGGQEDKLNQ